MNWEYTTIQYMPGRPEEASWAKDATSRLGAKGWEMVGVAPHKNHYGTDVHVAHFKRQIPSPSQAQ